MALEYSYQVAVFWNLIATSIWISLRFETSFAVERPLHLSFFTLLFLGIFWFALRRWDPSPQSANAPTIHPLIPIDERVRPDPALLRLQKFVGSGRRVFTACKPSSVLLVTCTVIRALILRSIILDVQCSGNGIEILLPLLLSLHEVATNATRSKSSLEPSSGRTSSFSTFLIASLAFLAFSASFSAEQSSYICPSRGGAVVHLLQILGVFLDAWIITAISKITKDVEFKVPLRSLSQMALTSAFTLGVLASCFLFTHTEQVRWSLYLKRIIVVDLLFTSLLCANFIASAVYLLRELRPITVFTVASCVLVYFSSLQHQVIDSSTGQGAFMVMSVGVLASLAGLIRLEKNHARFQQRSGLNGKASKTLVGIFIFISTSTIFFASKVLLYPTANNWSTNSITTLISDARSASNGWISQAGKSKSLQEATIEYQNRYKIPPPPGFDKWYAFATSRNSIIIDSFDQIHHDLQPFWGMPPAQIRQMTAHILDRPWTELAGLRIANGTTSLGVHIVPTHRWMVEGAADIINKFSKWLPDMDLAFNLNDESRVAIPWAEMNDFMAAANVARLQLNQTKTLQKSFSTNTWESKFMEEELAFPANLRSEQFKEASIRPSWDAYGSMPCSSSSPARSQKWWNKKSPCHSCFSPHSLGPYIANWTLAGSICHQPDLANLHGFHLSPSAFKGTNSLFPVFSQSKIPTFSDILFPSPWNYMRKVGYEEKEDMPFSDKQSTLFWKGATSEGFSVRGAWKGMQRQRFVHLSNHTLVKEVKAAVNISVSFVHEPTRCHGPDCDAQLREFTFSEPVDFKEHWKYKYLLDLDGAGFSGRFLPFLESKSLVLRAAGFRQWFEERLTPWRDFIPLDARGGDLGGLLNYFGGAADEATSGSGGWVGKLGKRWVDGDGGKGGRRKEAERIAREGGDKARKVLRKEDMEVYLFRLLLEWGRIVDDRRGELGFVYVNEHK